VGDPVNDISKVLITVSNGISCAVDIKSQLYCWGTEIGLAMDLVPQMFAFLSLVL